jgi:hypothetical protein
VACAVAAALVGWLATGPSARAADGVIEINQARATAGGVTPADTPGLPVTLDAPGSYRLTGNLTVPSANTSAILVISSGVSIDLGGFAIIGPNRCSGTPLTCTATGSGRGIDAFAATRDDVHVHDGSVVGMGEYGVLVSGRNARIENVRALHNGSRGISTGPGAAVTGCVAAKNGGYGIGAGDGSLVRESVSGENGLGGVFVEEHGVVERNAIAKNGFRGIFGSGDGITIRQNALNGNLLDGVRIVGSGALVADNAAIDNTAAGFDCGTGCAVLGNLAVGNHIGLTLGADSAYRRNTLVANQSGVAPLPVSGAGVERGNNFCSGIGTIAATCP